MSGNRFRSRGLALRWLLAAAIALQCIVYVLNVPFYAGSTIGSILLWRMEHGRLTIEHRSFIPKQSFYVAANSEGLRFSPRLIAYSWRSWNVIVPLWMPIALTSGLLSVSMVRERRRAKQRIGLCQDCGYDIRGLARCPECGKHLTQPLAASRSRRASVRLPRLRFAARRG